MRLKPPQVVALSFLAAIIIGTLLLSLPIACGVDGGVSLVDRIFTATSATCVTGLIVRDTAGDWSPFGQAVIFILFQAGGLGIMTLSTFFAVLLGRKFTLKQNVIIHSALDHNRVYGAKTLIRYIVGLTIFVELIGASLLFLRWNYTQTWPLKEKLIKSVFHSVSAFCNAGFSLFSNSFMNFEGDIYINIIMISLIFLGGIGFIVILDLLKGIFSVKEYKKPRLSLQSKIVLLVSVLLIVIGAVSILAIENNNVLAGMAPGDKVLGSVFQAVTSRTAGFNTLPISKFAPPALMVLMLLMFIGASPGSTGGGIKTCTFAIIMATVWTMSKNRDKVFMFGRTIARTVVRRAILIFILALAWIFLATFLFVIFEDFPLNHLFVLLRCLFYALWNPVESGFFAVLPEWLSSPEALILFLLVFFSLLLGINSIEPAKWKVWFLN